MSSPNTTPLSYNGYIAAVATLAVTQIATTAGVTAFTDPDLAAITPQMLNYAELRIQRDLDLLPAQTSSSAYTLAASTNQLSVSVNDFVIIRTVGAVAAGVVTPLTPVTQEFINNVYGSSSLTGPPQYFAMFGGDQSTGGDTSNNILFGPYADVGYTIQISGTQRLPTLYQFANSGQAESSANFISTYLPDLLIMASMVYISAYQRNFSSTSANDPQMPVNYEQQYGVLLKGAAVEEARKRFSASGWTSLSPPAAASPTR